LGSERFGYDWNYGSGARRCGILRNPTKPPTLIEKSSIYGKQK